MCKDDATYVTVQLCTMTMTLCVCKLLVVPDCKA